MQPWWDLKTLKWPVVYLIWEPSMQRVISKQSWKRLGVQTILISICNKRQAQHVCSKASDYFDTFQHMQYSKYLTTLLNKQNKQDFRMQRVISRSWLCLSRQSLSDGRWLCLTHHLEFAGASLVFHINCSLKLLDFCGAGRRWQLQVSSQASIN